MALNGVRVVPSYLPHYSRVNKKFDLYDDEHDDEGIDEELNRRDAAYKRATTSTWSHLTSTMMRRSVGIIDRGGLFMLIFLAFAIAFLSLSMIFELAYPFDSEPDVLYEHARSKLITVQSFTDLALSGANVAVGVVQPLIPCKYLHANLLMRLYPFTDNGVCVGSLECGECVHGGANDLHFGGDRVFTVDRKS